MDSLTLRELVQATGGLVLQGEPGEPFTGVSTDSRTLTPGDLFIPLVGERFDGHRFLTEALTAGAAGLLLAPGPGSPPAARLQAVGLGLPLSIGGRRPFVVGVEDTLAALHRLAGYYRSRFRLPVVGVTGSVGKTTTKDLIAAVLATKWQTVATRGNRNNEVGLPLTVFSLDHGTEAACFELGMRGPGQIRELAAIVRPTIGVVTNVGETHLELLGTRENIARAKAELIEALPPDGTAVLNADDPRVAAMEEVSQAPVVRYGVIQPGEDPVARRLDVAGEGIRSFGVHGVRFTAVAGGRRFTVELPLPGVHNASNALAAAAVGCALHLSPEEIVRGLGQAKPGEMRLQTRRGRDGFLVIDDAYNASPASVRAALTLLGESRSGGAVVAILGDMLELGEGAAAAHRGIGEFAASLGIDRLVGVGPLSAHTVAGARAFGLGEVEAYETTGAAARAILGTLGPEDVVLIKGSRAMHMEEIVHALSGEAGTHE